MSKKLLCVRFFTLTVLSLMEFFPIQTRTLIPPKDDIFQVFEESISNVKEGDILFITSKIIAIHQGRCIKTSEISKQELIQQEADKRIISTVTEKDIYLTIKDNILIPSAGIDESNANGYFVLWPNNLQQICEEIHQYFCKKFHIKNLGIIITDSTTRPMKRGVVGIAIHSHGIVPLNDKRGETDLFGKPLQVTQINVLDALSAMAVYLMGEGKEGTPILIGRDIPHIQYTCEKCYDNCVIPPEQDLFKPLLDAF